MEPAKEVAVVMVPIPCQSHLNQLLQLSSLISSYNLPVYFLGSSTHNRQVKIRSHNQNLSKIHFHNFPTPPIEAPEPNPNNPEKTPAHLGPAVYAYLALGQPITLFIQELLSKTRKIIFIYDRTMAETVKDVILIPNVESYAFNCLAAFNLFFILWEAMGKPFEIEGEFKGVLSMKKFMPEATFEFIASRNIEERTGDIHNTSIVIDRSYIDLIGRKEIIGNKKQWAIWPRIATGFSKINGVSGGRHECMEWLDKQAPRSVIYVAFGGTTSLSDDEARELANGLEQSKQKFIWVLRDADKADIFIGESRRINLPEGFEERVKENGIVIREWAPQLDILAHKSTGGFMSHCGWNSCLESISMGVPIAAWPMHSDQPLNAIFLTEILKVGLLVREWGDKDKLVKAEIVKSVVQRLMGLDEGDGMRKRVDKLSDSIKESMEEGGESWKELNDFIVHISR